MTLTELRSMTVIQLRKFARENHIVLGAGVEKAAMIEKIVHTLHLEDAPQQQSFLDLPEFADQEGVPDESSSEPAPELSETVPDFTDAVAEDLRAAEENLTDDSVSESPSDSALREKAPAEEAAPSEPRFQAAWHSPDSPQSGPHASYSSTGTNRPAWQNTTPSGRPLTPEQRPTPLRPHSFGPRFGPSASGPQREPEAPAEQSPSSVSERAPFRPSSPLPERRPGIGGTNVFGPGSAAASAQPPVPAAGTPSAVPAPAPASSPAAEAASFVENASSAPTLEELLATGDFEQGGGILELHPDGYGFLRASHFMPSSRDIYVSMAQIRRFSLRTGDCIEGKIRPQREGDKYAALLYIDSVNGLPEEESVHRPFFDELTPVYPSRRMSLEAKNGSSLVDMRLIDLIAPLGFGQRGLLLCPPETGKRELLQHYANTISANYPDVQVLVLMIDLAPEDVTVFRESVTCPVLASTFDQAPESHLRLTEMVVERAMRLVEQKKDVVILADSLTRLAKIFTSSAVQQGRSVPGMVNPASLLRAKRMFGAARALKEGGSLTVIATMDIATGNKVDDSIVEEFKGTANMELMLDASLVQKGVFPPINLQRSFTKNSDLILNDQEKEGLNLIRQLLGSAGSEQAILQLVSMMDKTSTNRDLLLKMKDWFALMNMG